MYTKVCNPQKLITVFCFGQNIYLFCFGQNIYGIYSVLDRIFTLLVLFWTEHLQYLFCMDRYLQSLFCYRQNIYSIYKTLHCTKRIYNNLPSKWRSNAQADNIPKVYISTYFN